MLDNNFVTLYKTDYYEMKMYFSDKKNIDLEFEIKFSYANILFLESKKCIDFVDNKIEVVRESKIIYSILEQDKSIFEILKDASNIEKITYTGKGMTYLDAAIIVCVEHLNKINNTLSK